MIDLHKTVVMPDALALIPGRVARRLKCLPLGLASGELALAVADASDYGIIDKIERISGFSVRPFEVSDEAELKTAIQRYYYEDGVKTDNAPGLFESILNRAVQIRTSDIHLNPLPDGGTVYVRVDGALRKERELAGSAFLELVSAVKVMAGMDIAERRIPQDGQFEVESAGESISLRVATMPLIHGEKVTLRLLASGGRAYLSRLDALGMNPAHYEIFQKALGLSNGVVLLTGPTGSGKTTTLYAVLRKLAETGEKHILSIEDPVEMPIDGVNQVCVRNTEGLSFHKALRNSLRHDLNVVMIGEIRDAESADIAVKAAMTGHLVLSTLHTNDAVSVVTRLQNLGVAPYLLAATLRLSVAQRLVRTPCAHCAEKSRPSELLCSRLGLDTTEETVSAVGCAFCGHTGYSGRTGIFEMVAIDDHFRELILSNASESKMRRTVFTEYRIPDLIADGRDKIKRGITTAAEINSAVLMGI